MKVPVRVARRVPKMAQHRFVFCFSFLKFNAFSIPRFLVELLQGFLQGS